MSFAADCQSFSACGKGLSLSPIGIQICMDSIANETYQGKVSLILEMRHIREK